MKTLKPGMKIKAFHFGKPSQSHLLDVLIVDSKIEEVTSKGIIYLGIIQHESAVSAIIVEIKEHGDGTNYRAVNFQRLVAGYPHILKAWNKTVIDIESFMLSQNPDCKEIVSRMNNRDKFTAMFAST
jgi:hypothetical protein